MIYTIIWKNTVTDKYTQEHRVLGVSKRQAMQTLMSENSHQKEFIAMIPGNHPTYIAPHQTKSIDIDVRENVAFIFSESSNTLVLRHNDNVDVWVEDFKNNKKYIFTLGEDQIIELKNRKRK